MAPAGHTPTAAARALAGYRSPGRLVRLLFWVVTIGMVVALAAAIVGYAQLRTFDHELARPGTVPPDQLTSRDNWREVALAAVIIVLLVWWGLLIAWTHRLYRNLAPLGVRELRYGSGWAVGGWFVPFLNLVRPKQIVNDIWRAGDPGLRWRQDVDGRPVSPLLGWWWGLWISLVFFTGLNLIPPTDDLRGRSSLGAGLVWTGIFELAFGALTLLVVAHMTRRQGRRFAGDEAAERHDGRVVAILVGLAIVALLGTLAINVFLRTTLPDRVVTEIAVTDRADLASPDRSVRGSGL